MFLIPALSRPSRPLRPIRTMFHLGSRIFPNQMPFPRLRNFWAESWMLQENCLVPRKPTPTPGPWLLHGEVRNAVVAGVVDRG